MPFIEVEGKQIAIDAEGYLMNFEDWDGKVACVLADKEGVTSTCPLTDDVMNTLKFLRENFKMHNAFIIPAAICRNLHQPGKSEVDDFLGPSKAWKIAGLPKPSNDIIALLKEKCGW